MAKSRLKQSSLLPRETQSFGPADPLRRRADLSVTGEIYARLSNVLRQNVEILVLVIAALFLYSTFISRYFNEQDGINFALALSRYDVSAHRPHPPGYPVFIFVSSILYKITQDPLLSLTSVSVLSGGLTLIPTYAVAKRLFNREIAFFSALALSVTPGFWLSSEQAVSDSFFTFLLTLAISQPLVGRQSKAQLYASWGTLGLALGVRPFNFVFIAPFLFETSRVGRRRDIAYCAVILLSMLLLAFLPAVLLTGYHRYADAVFEQLTRHLRDDVNPFGLTPFDRLIFLLLTLANGLGANLPFSVLPFYPFVSSSLYAQLNIVLLFFLSGTSLFLLRRIQDFSRAILVFLWVVPYLAFVYLLGTPGYTRYMIPILPPLLIALIASAFYAARSALSSIRTPRISAHVRTAAQCAIIVPFVVSMFLASMPLAIMVHTEPAANVQLVTFVRSHYDPATSTIIVFHEYRAFQFYGSEYRYIHCCHVVQETLAIILKSSNSSDTILITSSALVALGRNGVTLGVLKVSEFSRSPLVNFEDPSVILYRIVTVPQ